MTFVVLGALVVGLTLGLLGSGGSILTVPALVYLVGHQGKVAIAESLAIVGTIALVGMIPYARKGQIDWKSVLFFGVPGMLGTYGGAWLSHYVSGTAQMVLFAVVMLFAAIMMFRSKNKKTDLEHAKTSGAALRRHPLWQIVLEGLAVGVLTGLVGVGGGFLIVPALVVLGGLPMRLAVGTSLVVVAMKSFSGFFKYQSILHEMNVSVDLKIILVFIVVGILGTLAGNAMSQRMNQASLKKSFAVLLVIMGAFVLIQEIPHLS